MIQLKTFRDQPMFIGLVLICIFLFIPMIGMAQGTSTPKKGPASTAYQEAKAEAERKMTNAPARIPPGTELIGPHINGEIVLPLPNYWDGVDDQSNLHVNVASDPPAVVFSYACHPVIAYGYE